MKKLKVFVFLIVFMFCSVVVFAVKDKDIPPWMEAIEDSGRGAYLIPKGAKKKVIGSQIIVETPNEYVARRLYEIEGYLQTRFQEIKKNQDKFQKDLEALKIRIKKFENNYYRKQGLMEQDLEKIKNDVKELSDSAKELPGEWGERAQIIEDFDDGAAVLESQTPE